MVNFGVIIQRRRGNQWPICQLNNQFFKAQKLSNAHSEKQVEDSILLTLPMPHQMTAKPQTCYTTTQSMQEILQNMQLKLSQSTSSISQMIDSTKQENKRLETEISHLQDKKLAITSLLERLQS